MPWFKWNGRRSVRPQSAMISPTPASLDSDDLAGIQAVDVVFKTKDGKEIRNRCVTQPSDHQKILLQNLGLEIPKNLRLLQM